LARGRTRSFDREEALSTAIRIFAAKGYAATRVAELCAAMGIASPSFYAAFTSKETLYEEAIERVAHDKVEAIFSALEPARDTREGVQDVLLRTVDEGSKPLGPPGCLVTLSFVDDEESPRLGALGRDKRRLGYEVFLDWLKLGREKGDVPVGASIEAMARMIATFQQGIAIQTRDGIAPDLLKPAILALMSGWPWFHGDAAAA
jgi:AcrR family transcriptional regulator